MNGSEGSRLPPKRTDPCRGTSSWRMKATSALKTRGEGLWEKVLQVGAALGHGPISFLARPSCHCPRSVNSAPTAVSHDGCYVTTSVRSCLGVGCVQLLWGGGTGILWQELMKHLNNIERCNLNGLRGEFALKHNANLASCRRETRRGVQTQYHRVKVPGPQDRAPAVTLRELPATSGILVAFAPF